MAELLPRLNVPSQALAHALNAALLVRSARENKHRALARLAGSLATFVSGTVAWWYGLVLVAKLSDGAFLPFESAMRTGSFITFFGIASVALGMAWPGLQATEPSVMPTSSISVAAKESERPLVLHIGWFLLFPAVAGLRAGQIVSTALHDPNVYSDKSGTQRTAEAVLADPRATAFESLATAAWKWNDGIRVPNALICSANAGLAALSEDQARDIEQCRAHFQTLWDALVDADDLLKVTPLGAYHNETPSESRTATESFAHQAATILQTGASLLCEAGKIPT